MAEAATQPGFSSAEAVEQGLVRPGGNQQSVLKGIEEEVAAAEATSQAGAQAQINSLDAIAKATENIGLEAGTSIGALPGQGDVILKNVGGIITTIKPSGQIIIKDALGRIILNILRNNIR